MNLFQFTTFIIFLSLTKAARPLYPEDLFYDSPFFDHTESDTFRQFESKSLEVNKPINGLNLTNVHWAQNGTKNGTENGLNGTVSRNFTGKPIRVGNFTNFNTSLCVNSGFGWRPTNTSLVNVSDLVPTVQRAAAVPVVLTNPNGCALNPKALPSKEPLFIQKTTKGKYGLVSIDQDGLALDKNSQILLICQGPKNKFNTTTLNVNSQETPAKCEKNTLFQIGTKKSQDISGIACEKIITGTAKPTEEACHSANGAGKIIDVGYDFDGGNWISLYTVCYDEKGGQALYAKHVLNGNGQKFTGTYDSRPGFKTEAAGKSIPVATAYKQASQRTVFNLLLGSSVLGGQYFQNNSYLARGHLAPDGDFIMSSWKYTSYYYINVVPQWQSINNGNWKSLENTVRKIAATRGSNLVVFTGAYETLTLPDKEKNMKRMTLTLNGEIPVPKYVWKVVYDPERSEAIGFICLNDPFTDLKEIGVCKNICKGNGYDLATWNNPQKGLIICCDAKELSKLVKLNRSLDYKKVLVNVL